MKIQDKALSDATRVQGNKTGAVRDVRRKKDDESTAAAGDRVSVSGSQEQVSAIRAQLDAIPDVRTERVAQLRDAVQSGTYRPDAGDIAEAMIREAILYERGVT